jgi:glycine oxidase
VLEEQCEVLQWRTDERKVMVETSQGARQADQVCVAAGPWSRRLLEPLVGVDILPVRGQMVLFRCRQPLISHVINEGPRYLVPRDDGRLLAGSTEEEVGFDKSTTLEGVEELRQFACQLLPALRDEPVERSWAGLRPASYDGFPYIGSIPGSRRAFVAAGHFRSGLTLSTGTARVLAQLMCDEPPEIDLDPFRIGR